jgi:membrane-bound lytic murein transglycosylase A
MGAGYERGARACGRVAVGAAVLLAVMSAVVLAIGCASPGVTAPPVTAPTPSAPPPTAGTRTPAAAAAREPAGTIVQPGARWVAVGWNDLPGWRDDRIAQALPALRRNCDARTPSTAAAGFFATACADLARVPDTVDDAALREWLMARFIPYRVEAPDGRAEGLVTGYFEPMLDASRLPRGAQRHALHRPPAGLVPGQPWYTRKESETLPAARVALRGREIAYVADPLNVLVIQIQGSGRVVITEPDGQRTLARLAFAAHNDQPYQSVGRWLIDQGELKRDGASWPAIRDWAHRNPQRSNEMLWINPRLVFFREEPLPDPGVGPRGAQGVPLTAERSIAVDPRAIPYGTPVWLDTTEPTSTRSLRRLVVAQDTGSAIVGAVRADYFWGAGERAEREAGRMKQPLRMWVLVPRAAAAAP